MYSVSIDVNGRVLAGRNVVLPFGSEYRIGLYANPGRHLVKVSVDGNNVTDGGLIVYGYNTTWLERPVAGSNRRFKFVSDKSVDAIAAGKSDIDESCKGLIRVEFYREKVKPITRYSYTLSDNKNYSNMVCDCATPRGVGVTVEGSQSSQTFTSTQFEPENTPAEIIIVTLQGETMSTPCRYCAECGAYLNPLRNYCPGCGRRVRV